MRRRALLASTGTTLATLSGGCLGGLRDALDSSTKLGWLGLSNDDSDPHRFQIQVKRREELVHDSTHEIRGRSEAIVHGAVVECTWGETAGAYSLRGRIDERAWVEQAIDEALDGAPRCVTARGVYDDLNSGAFEFYVRPGCDRVSEYDGGCSFATADDRQLAGQQSIRTE